MSDVKSPARAEAALNPLALDALENHQRQLDADGCEVGVSRQALDELLAAYKAAVDRVNRATDAEIGGIHRSFAPASPPAEALPSMTSGAEGEIERLNRRLAAQQALAEAARMRADRAESALSKPASPAGDGVQDIIALVEDYARDALPGSEYRLACSDIVEALREHALSSPASSSPAEAEALQAGVDAADLIAEIGDVELTEDGLSIRKPYDGDVDGDGRHIVVGGDIIATFEDSDAGMAARDLLMAALSSAPAQEDGSKDLSAHPRGSGQSLEGSSR